MKKAKKILSLLLCAILLVGGSIAGTVAYLTSTDEVTNTFTVGKVVITLDEAKVNEAGKPVKEVKNDETGNTSDVVVGNVAEATRVDINNYHLLPGHEYTKDPIVHVDNASEECYLFVIVKNEIAAIESDAEGDKTVATQIAENGWAQISVAGDETLYVYGTVDAPVAVAGGANKTVFKNFKIDGDKVVNVPEGETVPTDKLNLSAYADKNIIVTAYAVQKDGFEGKTAVEIWNAAFGA